MNNQPSAPAVHHSSFIIHHSTFIDAVYSGGKKGKHRQAKRAKTGAGADAKPSVAAPSSSAAGLWLPQVSRCGKISSKHFFRILYFLRWCAPCSFLTARFVCLSSVHRVFTGHPRTTLCPQMPSGPPP